MTRRAQTVHDYLLGVVLVILTIGVAIGLLGSAYEPFYDPVNNEDETMAENLGDEVVEANTTMWGERTVNVSGLVAHLDDNFQTVRHRAGIPDWKDANVTIRHDREVLASAGEAMTGEPEAREIRFVRGVEADGPYEDCQEGCRIVIRVW